MIHADGEITSIRSTEIVSMPAVSLEGKGTQQHKDFAHSLDDMGPDTLRLDRDQYRMVLGQSACDAAIEADFVEVEHFGLGRQSSGNHVYFGQLVVKSLATMDMPEHVAVKPHTMTFGPETTVNEWAANNYLNGISSYERAYVPLGVWRDSDFRFQLVTLYDHPVQSFDNVFWVTGREAEKMSSERVRKSLGICMYGLGLLAGVGAIHGDAQAKNLAMDRKRFRFIDLEEMELLPKDAEGNFVYNASTKDSIKSDLDTFIASCLGWGDIDELVVSAMQSERVQKMSYESYVKGVKRSTKNLGIPMPKQFPITQADISEGFRYAIEMNNLQP